MLANACPLEHDSHDEDDTPTYAHYERRCGLENEPTDISLRLAGKSPLWGHLLWNAGRVAAEYVDKRRKQLMGKTVLELGAAAALPSLLSSLSAKNVVATDYPDDDLIDNIRHNISWLENQMQRPLPISCQGYIWGEDTSGLTNAPGQHGAKFDLIIMSDLVFHHDQHQNLLNTCKACLSDDGIAFVVFTPHRPTMFEQDMAFFALAEQQGFTVRKQTERRLQPMFKQGTGCAVLRSTVFGYTLSLNKDSIWFESDCESA